MGRRTSGAVLVGLGILSSRLAGLVRERVFAYYLGNSEAAGAFRAAIRIPNLLQNLFGEGVLSASFIPVYARLLADGKTEEAGRVAGTIASLLALGTALAVIVGIPASPLLVDLLAPGFHGEARELAVRFVGILFPGVGLLVLSAWCLGVLNSHRRFFLSYVAPVLWNLGVITAMVAAGVRFGKGTDGSEAAIAEWAAWGCVVGSLAQLLAQLPLTLKLNGGLRLGLAMKLDGVRATLGNFTPALLSRGVSQLSGYVDQILSSFLGPASVAALGYGQTVASLPLSLFGVAITASELPEMARESATAEKVRERLELGLERLSFFLVPSAVAMALLGDVIAATLFQTGNFGARDAIFVWWILAGAALGTYATSRSRLYASVFWAMGDTRTPARLALVRVGINVVLGFAAVFPVRRYFGLEAACATALLTAAGSLAATMEWMVFARRIGGRFGNLAGSPASKVHWAAALAAAPPAYGIKVILPQWYPAVNGLVVLGSFAVLYGGLAIVLGSTVAKGILRVAMARLRPGR